MKHRLLPLLGTAIVLSVAASARVPAQQLSPPILLPGDATVGAAAGEQSLARLATGGDRTLAVWVDGRSALGGFVAPPDGLHPNTDVYAQLLDAAGQPLGGPIVVNQDPFGQRDVAVAWNGSAWLVVWSSERLSGFWKTEGIQAARVSYDGLVLDEPAIVIEDSDDYNERWPLVASHGGEWTVLWTDYEGGTVDFVAGATVSAFGQVVDKQTIHVPASQFVVPRNYELAAAGGRYLFVYERGYGGAPTGILLDTALTPIGAPIGFAGGEAFRPSAGANGAGFYVAWTATSTVRGTPVSSAGAVAVPGGVDLAAGAPFWQSSATPAVSWDGSSWAVAWEAFDFTAGNSLHGSQVDPAGALRAGSPFTIVASSPWTREPALANGNGRALLAWTDGRNTPANGFEQDIFGTTIAPGAALGPQVPVSISPPAQTRPRLAGDAQAGYLCVFRSETNGVRRILAQRLDGLGAPIDDEPFEIAAGGIDLAGHDVAWNGAEWLVVFEQRQGTSTLLTAIVRARRVLPDGRVLDGTPIDVLPGNAPAVGALGGEFLVVSSEEPQNHIRFIRAQRVRGGDGALLGSMLTVSNSYSEAPDVEGLDGRWLVAWQRRATHDTPYVFLRGAIVLADGSVQPHFSLEDASGSSHTGAAIARGDDRATVAWSDGSEIRARQLALDGTLLGVAAGIPVTSAPEAQFRPAIGWDGDQYLIAYNDYRRNLGIEPGVGDVFAARMLADGTVIDYPEDFPVASHYRSPEGGPAVAGGGGLAVTAHAGHLAQAPWATFRVVLRVLDDAAVGDRFCFGNGSGSACPCGNESTSLGGCANGTGAGALLSASGSSRAAEDGLVLAAEGCVPSQPVLLFQGSGAVAGGDGVVFGDGLRCAGGTITRLELRFADGAGGASFGPGLASKGAWAPGMTRTFQAWYRDPGGSPCGALFNLSSALRVSFAP